MSTRIDVTVEPDQDPPTRWKVRFVNTADPTKVLAEHDMRALDGRYPAPDAGGLDATKLDEVLDRLKKDAASEADIHALADHLFGALLETSWNALEPLFAAAGLVDLALHVGTTGLAGLPWEIMRRGGQFLAAGIEIEKRIVDIAITRRATRDRTTTYLPLQQPLRYMFVLGTELDDAVRSGAESIGLLRQIGPLVRDYFIKKQTPETLGAEVAAIRPHIVHVICHGKDGPNGVLLQMWNKDGPAYVAADELVERLVTREAGARSAPTIVILSACSTGDRLDATTSTDLASSLVRAGIPIVVGMSAEIRDVACRIFTRRMAKAIVDRQPLLEAAIAGRRAALRRDGNPTGSFDWGMIQIHIGDDVASGIRVGDESVEEKKLLGWLTKAGLPLDLDPNLRRKRPALCAATDVLAELSTLLRSSSLAALLIHALPPKTPPNWKEPPRVGKRRVFAEVAAAAIREGYIPVIVMPSKGGVQGYPKEPIELVLQIREAFKKARTRLDLKDREPVALTKLGTNCELTALQEAIEADAYSLAEEARVHDFIKQANGEVILMLHDVHLYVGAVKLALGLLGAMGAGYGRRVRVVMSWRKKLDDDDLPGRGPLDEDFNDAYTVGMSWITKVELRPLVGPQASFAYQRFLLHPFRSEPDYVAQSNFLDLKNLTESSKKVLRAMDRGTSSGCLGQLGGDEVLSYLDFVREDLHKATDEDLLELRNG